MTKVAAVPTADKVAYGRYLAGPLGHCIECHSGMTPQGPDVTNQIGIVGTPFKGPWCLSVASNITPKGVSHYSNAALKTVITTGVRPDGSRLKPPMGVPCCARMSTSDLDAQVTYLRSLQPK